MKIKKWTNLSEISMLKFKLLLIEVAGNFIKTIKTFNVFFILHFFIRNTVSSYPRVMCFIYNFDAADELIKTEIDTIK